jgi:hypothetical protein
MRDVSSSKDKRLFQRIVISLPLIFLKGKSNKGFPGDINDISANGIGLTTQKKFSCRTILNLIINIPNDGPFRAEGEVAWIKKINFHKYRIGVALKDVDLVGVSRVLTIAKSMPPLPPEEPVNHLPYLFRWFKKPGLATS